MHRVLERQIKQYLGERVAIPLEWRDFFESVSRAYGDLDERVLELENVRKAATNLLEDLEEKQKALAEAKAKVEALLESIGEGVVATDQDGKVILMNKAAEDLLGFTSQEILEKLFIHAISVQDAEGNQIPEKLQPITLALGLGRSTTTTTTTYYFVRKDGTRFPTAIIVTPVVLNSKTIGAVVAFRDIIKEKELDRAKTEFISIASHQLRTPVSALNWLAEALQFNPKNFTPKQKTYLGDLSSMTKRLVKLVEDLLDFSRIELKTGLAAEKNKVEISSFVEKFIKEMETYAVSKNHSIVLKKEGFKPTEIEINIKALVNILQNLLSNAIEYSPSNTAVTVVIENTVRAVKVLIYNKGPVILKEEQSHLFERFYRGESAKKMKAEGTGLGLYIVKNEIENIGGKVGFESVEGKDTYFWFTLPLKN